MYLAAEPVAVIMLFVQAGHAGAFDLSPSPYKGGTWTQSQLFNPLHTSPTHKALVTCTCVKTSSAGVVDLQPTLCC